MCTYKQVCDNKEIDKHVQSHIGVIASKKCRASPMLSHHLLVDDRLPPERVAPPLHIMASMFPAWESHGSCVDTSNYCGDGPCGSTP